MELQRDCLDTKVSVSTILRKAKVIASKLELRELSDWIDSELNGYTCSMEDLPPHRKGIGAPRFRNPYHGWCPIMTDDGWFGTVIRTVFFPQPVSELESLTEDRDTDTLVMQYSPSIQRALQEQLPAPMECALHFSKAQVASALDFTRNKTLEWALELEQKGILGEGFTFKESQKQEARMVTNHIYGGNIGVLGSVSGDAHSSGFYSVSGEINIDGVSRLVSGIREALPALPESLREDVRQQASELETELVDGNPRTSRIRAIVESLKSVLEGAGGNLAAAGILSAIASLAN